MTATILDGKKVAQQIRAELAEEVIEFIQNNGVVPCLAAVLVGDDPASEVYVRNKRRGVRRGRHREPAASIAGQCDRKMNCCSSWPS